MRDSWGPVSFLLDALDQGGGMQLGGEDSVQFGSVDTAIIEKANS
jgi:hypothetical protein